MKYSTGWLLIGVIGIFFMMQSIVAAADRVVVVPLGGQKCTSPAENSFTNSIGMTFNLIPAGTFTMGSPADEPGRQTDETQHQVTLTEPFYMQIIEVTNEHWNTIIFDSGLGVNPSQSHTDDNYPVETVNWWEAAYFANRLSIVEGKSPCYDLSGCNANVPGANMKCTSVDISDTCNGYRLPTEAQWEYAARAGTTKAYANPVYFDATDTETDSGFNVNLHAMGWYSYNRVMVNNNTEPAYEDGTKPVAAKQANAWGVYDMHGNVWEWTCDCYFEENDPNELWSYCHMRGGGWSFFAKTARSANEAHWYPSFRHDALGFRLALPQGQ